MLSSTSREGAGRRFATVARAFCLLLFLAVSLAAAPPNASPPEPIGPSPSEKVAALAARADAPPAAQPAGDLNTELQRLADATDQIQPSAPDAGARLKAVVRGLIEVVKADRREVVALRGGVSAPVTARTPRRSSRKNIAPMGTSAVPAAAIGGDSMGSSPASQTAAPAGGFFGKRGLTKFHRPGCIFGERIRPADRVYFKTAAEATAAGYEACKICKPGV